MSGGYDGLVAVHRMGDLEREMVVTIHSGNNVTSLALDTVSERREGGRGERGREREGSQDGRREGRQA